MNQPKKHHLHEKDDAERKSMNQNDSRRVLLPLRSTLKNTHQRRELRSYGNALNQTDCIAHQPDSGYHPRAYVWDHTHKRRSGLSVQKGGSISGPLFLCLKNPNFVVFQFHQGERIPAHVLAYIQSSWL
ncbi:hypothetical protein MW954_001469 [Shigella flexneri]|nr:hypothetical protein [Shigella flexneri]EJJ2009509.1 hypothetical protein [Shigella flexneri]